ncbi:hypothetical protein [Streptomyces sp. IMTB 2501]|uniref:hypothetical protein n=1 Tax=Streptomyces sp. IMTB 2501 TaxID=1776340 RepID=UPI002116D4D4|nr:hypothetical protein [Streptomyces sp. IMTB 2501]
MADEEGRDDGGGLDRDPQHTEVGGHDRQAHGGQKGLHEHVIAPHGVVARPSGGAFARQVCRSRPASDEGDGADDEQHPRGQGVGAQQPRGGEGGSAVEDVRRQQAPAQQDRHG